VSPFGPIDVDSHDWTVMLMRVGMLSKDKEIGAFLVESGRLAMITAMAGGAWVLRVMATTRAPAEEPESEGSA
jgi:nitrogen fixation protein FixH